MSEFNITRAVLYRGGIGWFTAECSTETDVLHFPVSTESLDDFLKTSVVRVKEKDAYVNNLSFETQQTEDPLFDTDEGITGVLEFLRGVPVQITLSDGKTLTGRIIGYQFQQFDYETEERSTSRLYLSFLEEESKNMLFFASTEIQRLFPLDERLRAQFIENLTAVASNRDKEKETLLRIQLAGETKKTVQIQFLTEVPAWKLSYRIFASSEDSRALTSEEKARYSLEDAAEIRKYPLEMWAIVDNNTKIDWVNCQLVLSTFLPVSFRYDLSTPLLVTRPVIERNESLGIAPVLTEVAQEKLKTAEEQALDMALSSASTPFFEDEAISMPRGKTRGLAPVAAMAPSPRPSSETAVQSTIQRSHEGGSTVEFNLSTPVTIKKGQSAMVLLTLGELLGEKMLLYNHAFHKTSPFKVLELQNTLEYTLDEGPITVLDQNGFSGESMLPRIGPNEKYLLSYALESDIQITQKMKPQVINLETGIEGEYSYTLRKSLRNYEWIIENKSSSEKTIIIELSKPLGWKLEEKQPTDRSLKTVWRFKAVVPAKTQFTLKRTISYVDKSKIKISSLSIIQLRLLLKNTELSEDVKSTLLKLLDLQRQLNSLKTEQGKLKNQEKSMQKKRSDILSSLQVLKDKGKEKETRERYIAQLEKLDKNLEENQHKREEVTTQIEQVKDEIDSLIRSLKL